MIEGFESEDRQLGKVMLERDKDVEVTIQAGEEMQTYSLFSPQEIEDEHVSIDVDEEKQKLSLKLGNIIRQYDKIALVTVSGAVVAAGVVKVIKAWRNKEFQNQG